MSLEGLNRGGHTKATPVIAPLDLNVEHVFELMDISFTDGVTETYKGKTQTVNKGVMVWKEADKTEGYHRIWFNFNEFYTEKSNLMKFLMAASGKPFVSDINVKIGDFLTEHHRIRARVTAKIGKEGTPNGYYKFIDASIKPAGSLTIPKAPQEGNTSLLNALFIAKGAKTSEEAFAKLTTAGAPAMDIQAFLAAHKEGKVTFPI